MTTDNISQIRAELVGAWRLITWQILTEDGGTTYPLGEDAIGQLMYDGKSGRMSAQLARVNQPRFVSDDWQQASPGEMCAAWPSYFGYFGTFTVDIKAAAVTHHIDSGWFPNLVGTQQVRSYQFKGGQLVLDADTTWGRVRIIWEKMPYGAS